MADSPEPVLVCVAVQAPEVDYTMEVSPQSGIHRQVLCAEAVESCAVPWDPQRHLLQLEQQHRLQQRLEQELGQLRLTLQQKQQETNQVREKERRLLEQLEAELELSRLLLQCQEQHVESTLVERSDGSIAAVAGEAAAEVSRCVIAEQLAATAVFDEPMVEMDLGRLTQTVAGEVVEGLWVGRSQQPDPSRNIATRVASDFILHAVQLRSATPPDQVCQVLSATGGGSDGDASPQERVTSRPSREKVEMELSLNLESHTGPAADMNLSCASMVSWLDSPTVASAGLSRQTSQDVVPAMRDSLDYSNSDEEEVAKAASPSASHSAEKSCDVRVRPGDSLTMLPTMSPGSAISEPAISRPDFDCDAAASESARRVRAHSVGAPTQVPDAVPLGL